MKAIKIVSLFLLVSGIGFSCQGQSGSQDETTEAIQSQSVTVYYFHNARRCVTCKTVEAESKKAVNELYGEEVLFSAYNLEEPDGKEKALQLDVSGQTLLIVGGDKKINLTNEGFMYARNNPDKLKQAIKESIDPLL